MKDVKENLVQWTDWDSNRECLNRQSKQAFKFNKNHHC